MYRATLSIAVMASPESWLVPQVVADGWLSGIHKV